MSPKKDYRAPTLAKMEPTKSMIMPTANETMLRTILRSVTWRCTAIVVGFSVAIASGASVGAATEIIGAYTAIQLVLHFLHDRAWSLVRWGRS